MSRTARIRSIALAGVATLVCLTLSAPVAAARPSTLQVPRDVTLAAQKLLDDNSSGNSFVHKAATGDVGALDVITCSAQSDYPHKSTTTPGSADGKARSWCTASISRIDAQAELYRYLPGYGFSLVGIGSLDYQMPGMGPVSSAAFDSCQGSPQY
jgi:hypothetical protein